MVALGLSTSLGGILSGCHHARLHPRQALRQAESGTATIAGVSKECASVEIGRGKGVSKLNPSHGRSWAFD